MSACRRHLLAAALAFACLGPLTAAQAAAPPAQATSGPGGTDYVTAEVIKQAYGTGSDQGLLFRPGGKSPTPRPVVIFVHPPGAFSPKYYGGWIEHLVRKGNIVIYPRYQEDVGKTAFDKMAEASAKGVKAALAGLAADPDANPDLGKVVAIGHAGGALIAADLAAAAAKSDLPPIKLVFGIMPAKAATEKVRAVPMGDLSSLPAKTVLVMMTGDRDAVAGEAGARAILRAATGLDQNQKLLIRAGSDNHGQPPLYVGHYSPVAPNAAYDLAAIPGANAAPPPPDPATTPKKTRREIQKETADLWRVGYEERKELPSFEGQALDATDYLVFWRTFDLVAGTVLGGGDAMAVKRDGRLYNLGLWSDGWPLKRLTTETPKAPEPKAPEAKPEGAGAGAQPTAAKVKGGRT